jgi:hypothetical protein
MPRGQGALAAWSTFHGNASRLLAPQERCIMPRTGRRLRRNVLSCRREVEHCETAGLKPEDGADGQDTGERGFTYHDGV